MDHILRLGTNVFESYNVALAIFAVEIIISVAPIIFMMAVHKATIKKNSKVENQQKKEDPKRP